MWCGDSSPGNFRLPWGEGGVFLRCQGNLVLLVPWHFQSGMAANDQGGVGRTVGQKVGPIVPGKTPEPSLQTSRYVLLKLYLGNNILIDQVFARISLFLIKILLQALKGGSLWKASRNLPLISSYS